MATYILYHGTSRAEAEHYLKHGMTPKPLSAIYLTADKNVAKHYSMNYPKYPDREHGFRKDPTLLQVTLTDEDFLKQGKMGRVSRSFV